MHMHGAPGLCLGGSSSRVEPGSQMSRNIAQLQVTELGRCCGGGWRAGEGRVSMCCRDETIALRPREITMRDVVCTDALLDRHGHGKKRGHQAQAQCQSRTETTASKTQLNLRRKVPGADEDARAYMRRVCAKHRTTEVSSGTHLLRSARTGWSSAKRTRRLCG